MAQAAKKFPQADGLPDGAKDMKDAPKDGRWVELTVNLVDWVRAKWYETRVRQSGSIAWVKATCWSTSDPPRLSNRIENPLAWRDAAK